MGFEERLAAAHAREAAESAAKTKLDEAERVQAQQLVADVEAALNALSQHSARLPQWGELQSHPIPRVHPEIECKADIERHGSEWRARISARYADSTFFFDVDLDTEPDLVQVVTGRSALPAQDRSERYSLAELIDSETIYLWAYGWEATLPVGPSFILTLTLEALVAWLARNLPHEASEETVIATTRADVDETDAWSHRDLNHDFEDAIWLGFTTWFWLAWRHIAHADGALDPAEGDVLANMLGAGAIGNRNLLSRSEHDYLGSLPDLAFWAFENARRFAPEVLGPMRAEALGEPGSFEIQGELAERAGQALRMWIGAAEDDQERDFRERSAMGLGHEVVNFAVRTASAASSPDATEEHNIGQSEITAFRDLTFVGLSLEQIALAAGVAFDRLLRG